MNFDLENQDEQDLQDYINSQKEGRINPVEKAPVLDMKTNPRLTPPSPGEKVLPTEEKSEYWREELRRGKDPREVLNQYLMERLTQRERGMSPSAYQEDVAGRKESAKDKMFLNLLKSGADLGASFGNRRYIDPNSPIPTSGYNPEIPISAMEERRKESKLYGMENEKAKDLDQNVLMYLSQKRAEQDKSKWEKEKWEKEANLKRELAKIRSENDPMKAILFEMKKSEAARQAGEYEMKRETHQQKAEENRRKYNPANVQEKLENLNSTDKQRMSLIINGMSALNDIMFEEKRGQESFNKSNNIGDMAYRKAGISPWRFSIWGDNEYTASANRFKEFIGRLQSGGAIGAQEAKDFLNLIPGEKDSASLANKKLNDMKKMFLNNAKLHGFDENDLNELMGSSKALVTETPKISKQQQDAIDWYSDPKNANDPNHKAVGDKLRSQGLIK